MTPPENYPPTFPCVLPPHILALLPPEDAFRIPYMSDFHQHILMTLACIIPLTHEETAIQLHRFLLRNTPDPHFHTLKDQTR